LCGVGLFAGSFWMFCTFNYTLGQIGRADPVLSQAVRRSPAS
jgi:hypothetical protein